jgi:beta-glucanase (GH16 family)
MIARGALRRLAIAVAALLTVTLATAAPSSATSHHYTSRAVAHAAVKVRLTIRATMSATVSVTSAYPRRTITATARATATASGSATRHGTATRKAVGATKAKARAKARSAARAAARRIATSRARTAARAQALRTARSRALAIAKSAAAAKAKAEVLAVQQRYRPTGTPARPCGGSLPKTAGTWTCTFDDEFNGTKLDSTKWIPVTSALSGATGGPACYTDSPNNISESGGTLNLTARKEAAPFTCSLQGLPLSTQYTSGQVASTTKFSQTYGRFSVRAKFPATTVAGLQSSLWLWPQNRSASTVWPASGEIDIAEEYSQYADRAFPYVHYLADPIATLLTPNTNVVTNNSCRLDDVNAFHEYTVEWTKSAIHMSYDGKTCLVDNLRPLGASPFDQPYFIALTQALGIGTNAFRPTATPLPATTQIDWVRVWQ